MCVVLSSTGSEFHSVGPETAKLCEPMRTVRVRGTARFPCAAERRRWEPLGLPTGEIISARYMYEGASPVTMQALVDRNTMNTTRTPLSLSLSLSFSLWFSLPQRDRETEASSSVVRNEPLKATRLKRWMQTESLWKRKEASRLLLLLLLYVYYYYYYYYYYYLLLLLL